MGVTRLLAYNYIWLLYYYDYTVNVFFLSFLRGVSGIFSETEYEYSDSPVTLAVTAVIPLMTGL